MTNRERTLLIAGLLVGLALGSVIVMWALKAGWNQPELASTAKQPTATAADTAPSHDAINNTSGGEIELTKPEQDAIGLRTDVVVLRPVTEELRTVGRVEQAETQLATISARVAGRIDKLYIDFTGQPVMRGQPIASIYSPQVVSAAEEYKLALRARSSLGADAHPQAIAQGDDLIQASRRRLELWGLTKEQIDEIAKSDKLNLHITTYSTVKGTVAEKKVTEGQYVQEGEALYTVSDLSTVWVLADVYEADLGSVRVGQSVRIEAEGLPGTTMRGSVSFIDPNLNPVTRTASVRIQLANPGFSLRPGMFVHVTLASGSSQQLVVSRSAVLDTGAMKVVYVAKQDGMFERREVEVGTISGEFTSIRKGLKEGERVVSNGAFLIDSQTRVSGGMSGMFGGSKGFENDKSVANGPSNTSAKYAVDIRFEPDALKVDKPVRAFVNVRDAAGQIVSDANVTLTLLMPAMPSMGMAEVRNTHTLAWDGKQYSSEAKIQSAGTWIVMVDAMRNSQRIASKRSQMTVR